MTIQMKTSQTFINRNDLTNSQSSQYAKRINEFQCNEKITCYPTKVN